MIWSARLLVTLCSSHACPLELPSCLSDEETEFKDLRTFLSLTQTANGAVIKLKKKKTLTLNPWGPFPILHWLCRCQIQNSIRLDLQKDESFVYKWECDVKEISNDSASNHIFWLDQVVIFTVRAFFFFCEIRRIFLKCN